VTKRKTVIQTHHITYDPPWIVTIWKGEHWLLTMLSRRKKVSKGFVVALKEWLRVNEGNAINLTDKYN